MAARFLRECGITKSIVSNAEFEKAKNRLLGLSSNMQRLLLPVRFFKNVFWAEKIQIKNLQKIFFFFAIFETPRGRVETKFEA